MSSMSTPSLTGGTEGVAADEPRSGPYSSTTHSSFLTSPWFILLLRGLDSRLWRRINFLGPPPEPPLWKTVFSRRAGYTGSAQAVFFFLCCRFSADCSSANGPNVGRPCPSHVMVTVMAHLFQKVKISVRPSETRTLSLLVSMYFLHCDGTKAFHPAAPPGPNTLKTPAPHLPASA